MNNICDFYSLDGCLDWILQNGFKRIVIQLKISDLKHSAKITTYLQEKFLERCDHETNKPLDIYVTQSSTCCVDLIVTQHVSNLDAIIHFGQVCLTKPYIAHQEEERPILFSFGHPSLETNLFNENVKLIVEEIEALRSSELNLHACILYDTSLIDYATKLEEIITSKGYRDSIHVAYLSTPNSNWQTVEDFCPRFIKNEAFTTFGQYLLPKHIRDYNCAIYIGNCPSLTLTLDGPSKLLKFDCSEQLKIERVNVSKLLNRRMALVGRLKDEEELKIGVIITNPLPDISNAMERLEGYAKKRKHTLYFISMIQTIDECKIGNFDLCDAFIVINSCTCSTILESLVYNRPIITELEFKLVCGFEAEYGRVLWPGTSTHLSEDDMINKRKVSDVTLALIHTRNDLLERCSQARVNKWSGLEYKATGSCEGHESLVIEEGLKGIASSYLSEPLKRAGANEETELSNSTTTPTISTNTTKTTIATEGDAATVTNFNVGIK